MTTENATLAGGCFWCIEAALQRVRGVLSVTSGYTGGTLAQPTYEEVCTGRTGHAEAVRVVFDPEVLPYADLLRLFFAVHDPTTVDRQGADVGPQYRSAIFYESEEPPIRCSSPRASIGLSMLLASIAPSAAPAWACW